MFTKPEDSKPSSGPFGGGVPFNNNPTPVSFDYKANQIESISSSNGCEEGDEKLFIVAKKRLFVPDVNESKKYATKWTKLGDVPELPPSMV